MSTMRVNISFSFDSVTQAVTELKVSQVEDNTEQFDLSNEQIQINNNTVSIPDAVLLALNLKYNDRIGLIIESESTEPEFNVYLANPSKHNLKDEMTYRVTQKGTINVRGNNNAILNSMGPDFNCQVVEEGKIKLTVLNTNF